MKLYLLVLVLLLFTHTHAISFKLTTRQSYCYRKTPKPGETIFIFVHISGTNPGGVKINLFDPDKKELFLSRQQMAEHTFTFEEKSIYGGRYEICFESPDYKNKEINFTIDCYFQDQQKAHANEESIDALESKFHQLSVEMDKIKQHIEAQQNDEEAQYSITKANNRKVLWWSLGKILLIILACLFEVYLVTSYFAGNNTLGKRLVKLGMKSESSTSFGSGV